MRGQGLICVSIAAKDAETAIRLVQPVLPHVDVVELRLDAMQSMTITDCLHAIPKPVLVANRPRWEGGRFDGPEEDRVATLCQAVAAGAAYADIELLTDIHLRHRLLAAARSHGAQVVLSSHDFTGTPPLSALRLTLQHMHESGCDIGKIVTTAANSEEALRILSLQLDAHTAGFPLASFAMGEAGRITRFATLYLGGHMTYAAPDELLTTAPGQLSVARLNALVSSFERQP